MTTRRTRTLAAVLIGAVTAALAIAAAPRPPALSEEVTGDAGLAERARVALAESPGARDELIVVEIDGETTRFAGFGADESTEVEVGSITKTLTAALLAEAVERGEARPETPVGELLELGDAPIAQVTLEELALHRSGLPSTGGGLDSLGRGLWASVRAGDPYPQAPDAVLADARAASLDGRGEVAYSNMGMALLGQALAAAADAEWSELVEDRVLGPAGLDTASAPTSPEDLAADAPRGRTGTGRPAAPWTLGSYAPAGSVRMRAADLEGWARAMLEAREPWAGALEPRFEEAPGQEVGWAWFTTEVEGAEGTTAVTWHNGGTGGYRSMLALDREAGRAVAIVSNTSASVDAAGFALLLGEEAGR
ncbi:serine hydrolase domain-containing protein [Homoserinibacter sp. YIM 151385]|uniref:serine hydrolase domain-containing protein n=1 Tax=Homoserinibacter sp. YIM 151385 TaxID=2985506 RepID=UPI0022EFF2D9|nr:serine hydrolase domain-containing protein [Homoserinibacter sp. YIM 151385]WBU39128.1 serine hydrolase [Homoserinibacter sp. YIM 151385]